MSFIKINNSEYVQLILKFIYLFDSLVDFTSPFKPDGSELIALFPLTFVSHLIPSSFLTAVDRISIIVST
jgi:hypothetical protein